MIVVDASVVVDLLLEEDFSPKVIDKLSEYGDIVAPYLVDHEVLNSIWRQLRLGKIDVARADLAIDDLANLTIARKPTHGVNHRIWDLRDNLTPYDAAYVALAEILEVPLVTRDTKIARAAQLFTPVIVL